MHYRDDYKNIDIIIATKHQKELAIQEPFSRAFNATLFIPPDFDTDTFGTFTGEIERLSTPYETVISKAKSAMQTYGYKYGIANEGSFGPHPAMPFIPGDVELMSFIDNRNDLIIVESEVTTETNYSYIDLAKNTEYDSFLNKILFGTHGVVIRNLEDLSIIAKGITQRKQLDDLILASLKTCRNIRLETDMRAMMNPTRMKVIHRLAEKLVKRLQQSCPACYSPGFGKISVTGNLPCMDCGTLTELYQSKVLHCVKCEYHELLLRDDGAVNADAKYCPYCNP